MDQKKIFEKVGRNGNRKRLRKNRRKMKSLVPEKVVTCDQQF